MARLNGLCVGWGELYESSLNKLIPQFRCDVRIPAEPFPKGELIGWSDGSRTGEVRKIRTRIGSLNLQKKSTLYALRIKLFDAFA
jgi:hypothetical protein